MSTCTRPKKRDFRHVEIDIITIANLHGHVISGKYMYTVAYTEQLTLLK